MPNGTYGGGFWRKFLIDVYDRTHGAAGRANARLGFLAPLKGRGKVIWIKTDADRTAFWLAVELTRAIRERRQDARIIVTFEHEYPEFLVSLEGLPKVAVGFGPADTKSITARVLATLEPVGVIAIHEALRPCLAKELHNRGIPCVVVHGLPDAGVGAAGFPGSADEQRAWGVRAVAPAPFVSLLVEAQVEPVFQGVAGAHARALWWISDVPLAEVDRVIHRWHQSALSQTDVLFIGSTKEDHVRLSAWKRDPFAPGTVIMVDDSRFWPALAVSCAGIHVIRPSEPLLWQVLAGGHPVSTENIEALGLLSRPPLVESANDDIFVHWESLLLNPGEARRLADAVRRFFWNERRQAAAATEMLLSRVYAW